MHIYLKRTTHPHITRCIRLRYAAQVCWKTMNTSIHLAKRPTDKIIPGETFEVRKTPIPTKDDVKEGQVLVRVDYLSVDPGIYHMFFMFEVNCR